MALSQAKYLNVIFVAQQRVDELRVDDALEQRNVQLPRLLEEDLVSHFRTELGQGGRDAVVVSQEDRVEKCEAWMHTAPRITEIHPEANNINCDCWQGPNMRVVPPQLQS